MLLAVFCLGHDNKICWYGCSGIQDYRLPISFFWCPLCYPPPARAPVPPPLPPPPSPNSSFLALIPTGVCASGPGKVLSSQNLISKRLAAMPVACGAHQMLGRSFHSVDCGVPVLRRNPLRDEVSSDMAGWPPYGRRATRAERALCWPL